MSENLKKLPLLPLRDIVMFPSMIAPLFIGREKSIKALEHVVFEGINIVFSTQRDAIVEEPLESDLYEIGVLASVLQLTKSTDGTVKVIVEGKKRVMINKISSSEDFLEVTYTELDEIWEDESRTEALTRSVIAKFEEYAKLNKKINPEIINTINSQMDSSNLTDIVSTNLNLRIDKKQKILEMLDINERLYYILGLIESEITIINTQKQIDAGITNEANRDHRNKLLEARKRIIDQIIGEQDKSVINENTKFESSVENMMRDKLVPQEVKDVLKSEVSKLTQMNNMSAEAGITRNYISWLLALPWKKNKKLKTDIVLAEKKLDEEHYGLQTVKETILEYLAVQQRVKTSMGAVICLVGPPGVGKTSLVKSIAAATGREFVKFSLGGVKDESEIRGHRRTYVGSMPGKIIQALKKVKTSNPVFLLDEIDKMGSDYRGDPASALLEVLDPEQNSRFNDNYLEIDYDLSNVMFIATANSYNIPHALLDRLEIIKLSGYVESEKIEIAKRYLVNKQRESKKLTLEEWSVSDDSIDHIIKYYTREAGVRQLNREIEKLARKTVRQIAENKTNSVTIDVDNLKDYLGVHKFDFGVSEKEDQIGVISGLAYTETGGDLLIIEAVKMPGKGHIKATGKIGEVMQESTHAAFSCFRARSMEFGVNADEYQKFNIHLHFPQGAVPKDGPSAGVAIFLTILSIMTGTPIRKDVAITGEVTLRGRVLPIGGLKEKLLAASRTGIKTVMIPKDNEKDLVEIPENIKASLEIIPIYSVDQAVKIAFSEPIKTKINQLEEQITKKTSEKVTEEILTH